MINCRAYKHELPEISPRTATSSGEHARISPCMRVPFFKAQNVSPLKTSSLLLQNPLCHQKTYEKFFDVFVIKVQIK
jgi:hypothetical protein